jgi:hypothetical protein
MKYSSFKISTLAIGAGILLNSLLFSITGAAQTKHQTSGNVKIVIEGTSNIHDWDMKSDKGICNSVLDIDKLGSLTSMSTLSFSIPAQSLKSEHSGMDKNTYKALNTSRYSSIQFVAGSVDIKPSGTSGHLLTARGKLTIAGVSKDVILTATGVTNADKSITYSGSYQLKMTDYNVDPPTALLGTIRTGDKITVKYSLVLKTL